MAHTTPQLPKEIIKATPIENRSLFPVKKRAANPRVPEPGRMLLPPKNECKSFLELIHRILGTYSSGTRIPLRPAFFFPSSDDALRPHSRLREYPPKQGSYVPVSGSNEN